MFYTTHKSAAGKRGRKIVMTSSCQSSDSAHADTSVSHSWIPGSPCMPWLEQPCSGAAGDCTVLQAINVLLPPQAPGLRPVSATHLAGVGLPTPAPAEGRDGRARGSNLGLDRACRVTNGAGNSQPICTKITAAEASSFHNRHPHTLFPFYLGFAHGFRIRIC